MANLRAVCHPCHAARHGHTLPWRRNQSERVTH
jgi:hypothetical protein